MSKFKDIAKRMLTFIAAHSDSPTYCRPNTLGLLLKEGLAARAAAITYPSSIGMPLKTAEVVVDEVPAAADAAPQRPSNRG